MGGDVDAADQSQKLAPQARQRRAHILSRWLPWPPEQLEDSLHWHAMDVDIPDMRPLSGTQKMKTRLCEADMVKPPWTSKLTT